MSKLKVVRQICEIDFSENLKLLHEIIKGSKDSNSPKQLTKFANQMKSFFNFFIFLLGIFTSPFLSIPKSSQSSWSL